MDRSRSEVATPNASRYLVQLSRHWSHRFDVRFDETASHIPFDSGAVCRLEARDGRLLIDLEAPEGELERMQGVVADHLNRFAFREGELAFDWRGADPG